MSLVKSISGLRGQIGGLPGNNLTPVDIVGFAAAYGRSLKRQEEARPVVVVGRDARISGEMVRNLVVATLNSVGVDVIDLGLASTPGVEMAVVGEKAQGGIIITASHNPQGWNALKLLDGNGEFLTAAAGQELLAVSLDSISFNQENELGECCLEICSKKKHRKAVLNAPLVDREAISRRKFKLVVDGINSVGGLIIPDLLKSLGVEDIVTVNCAPTGHFAHKPEPLAENLIHTMAIVKEEGADLGIVVDPDVDRLAFIDERGAMFGEEYTLVAVADYVLANFSKIEALYPGKYKKAAVSNLSSSRALRDICSAQDAEYGAAAVGEVNVVAKMKELEAVIGGEGNGGVIFPVLHYGRDALMGVALFLSALALNGLKVSEYRKKFPAYEMVKDRLDLDPGADVKALLEKVRKHYAADQITDIDGLKIDRADSWIHLRASNTEPIIRIYVEARTAKEASALAAEAKKVLLS